MRFIFLLALCCCTIAVAKGTEPVSRDSFAYGYSLEVDGDGAIYSLYLNETIYQGLVREDRGDLRIFNSRGAVVPHDIRRAEQMIKKSVPEVSLAYFPLYTTDRHESISTISKRVRITTNDQGSIIDLNYGKTNTQQRFRAAYIIDASSIKDTPRHLTLDWNSDNEQFIMRLRLEGSQNLNSWHTIVSSATISNMKWNQHTLVQRKIELPARLPKYLRLSWPGDTDLDLTSVNMHFSDTYHAQTRQWSEFTAERYDPTNATYYFNTNTVIPADRLMLVPKTRNTVLNVQIETASTPKGPWYSRYHGLVYDLQFDDIHLASPAITQTVNSHRFWRVRILGGDGGQKNDLDLRLGWIPEQLLFVATGESPFTLTYGSARVGPVSAPLAMLLSETEIKKQGKLIKPARLGASLDFGNRSKLEPEAPRADWKKYILWAVLILGVIVLAIMALRLYKQMDQPESKG